MSRMFSDIFERLSFIGKFLNTTRVLVVNLIGALNRYIESRLDAIEKKEIRSVGKYIVFFVVIMWSAWIFLMQILVAFGIETDLSKLGPWGDSFGALNSLFSALGFSAVAITLFLQQKQNKNNEDEQHRQRFDTSFFELLRFLRENREIVSFKYSQKFMRKNPAYEKSIENGYIAFRNAWRESAYWIKYSEGSNKWLTPNEVGNLYHEMVHKRYEGNFGAYFRLVYSMLSRIERDRVLSNKEKIYYANLLRGQLTSFETAVIALNALTPISKDLKDLITHFRLLKYIPEDSDRREILSRYYNQSAFAPRNDENDELYS